MALLKNKYTKRVLNLALILLLFIGVIASVLDVRASWMGPEYMIKLDDKGDQTRLAITFRNSREVGFYSTDGFRLLGKVQLDGTPTGITSTTGGQFVIVTQNAPDKILVIDPTQFKIVRQTEAQSGVCAPVFDAERDMIYVCNRWPHSVSAYKMDTLDSVWTTQVLREPSSAVLDAKRGILYVPNRQTVEPANQEQVHTKISLLDVSKNGKKVKDIRMESGINDYHGLAVSPDGNTIAVLHNYSKFFQATFQIEWAWMNSSYVTFIDAEKQAVQYIIPLDDVIRGAASPWAVEWTSDGKTLLVSHSGVHELSVINLEEVIRLMNFQGDRINYIDQQDVMGVYRHRVLTGGNGPRSFVQLGTKVIVANFFTDNLGVIDRSTLRELSVSPNPAKTEVMTYPLNPDYSLTLENRGEMYFNDAMLSKQNWQSCIGCHPDGRADGFNWDLLNDGLGNLKNTKSLLYSHETPPAMVTGIRPDAEYAVRSGIRAILFTQVNEEQALAMDAYLKAMRPVPSPYLVKGELSEKALEGKDLFEDSEVGCIQCHFGTYFTDQSLHDVGTAVADDAPHTEWDTPTLIECWRTAPYLHDGSAVTIMDVLTTRNKDQKHGHTSQLTREQLEALAEYVLSL